jgi:hypothetical protein
MKRAITVALLLPALAAGFVAAIVYSAANAGYLIGAWFFDKYMDD